MKRLNNQMVKGKIMIKVKNPNQLNIFDPWHWLTPKRRQMLDAGWPGIFREQILPFIPVHKVGRHFSDSLGRPTKELYSILGALILQQAFDLTDEETLQQYAFNIQWHYSLSLNIYEESDTAKYISLKTLWNNRNIVAQNNLENDIFSAGTEKLAQIFNVSIDKQRIDSVHIKSNMRRLGRIGIFSESIHKFLVNLKRSNRSLFDTLEKKVIHKYLSENALGCFSRVKPSELRKTLTEVGKDLFNLIQEFKQCPEVAAMYSYKLLERVLKEQCNLVDDKENPVELKKPKEIVSDSLQNPSDPDATYSGHKGQGYQVQVMETFCEKEKSLNLITHVNVEPAHNSDANALIPAIESAEKRNLKPKELTADSLYGSDDNCERAKAHDVELIAPTMGSVQKGQLSLADFKFSLKGEVVACPQGHPPVIVRRKKRVSIGFASHHCRNCSELSKCPVKKGKKYYYLRFTDKEMRIAKRRIYEHSDQFKDRYRWRAGVEAMMSEYDRRTGVKHLRVRGLKAVRFSAVLKALGINLFRAAAFRALKMRPEEGLCAA
ncbi:MAG: transposase [Gammaproteobacteria bacterium]|nr:transposase [Gammaproteobacteria bacterium]